MKFIDFIYSYKLHFVFFFFFSYFDYMYISLILKLQSNFENWIFGIGCAHLRNEILTKESKYPETRIQDPSGIDCCWMSKYSL